MPIDIYCQYRAHDGEPIWDLHPERLEYGFELGSQGPSGMSHFTPFSEPTMTRDIVAPKRNDYMLQWSNTEGDTRFDLQGGFLWDAGISDEEFGVSFHGIDWSGWLDQPIPQDRELTRLELLDDPSVLLDMHFGMPTSPYDWFDNGTGVNQRIIITDLLEAIGGVGPPPLDTLVGPNPVNLQPAFSGSHYVNVPKLISGAPSERPFSIDPFDDSPVRQHINTISNLNDPWIPNFRTNPDKVLDFFFMKNKDPAGDIVPDFALHDEEVIVHLDWSEHGPRGTYVTGWGGSGSLPKWFTTTHAASDTKFRRWRSSHQLGPHYKTQEQVNEGTKAFADKFPQKDCTVIYKPEKLDPNDELTGFQNLCGFVVDIDYDYAPFHRIDAIFYIISQRFSSDSAGNWLCEAGLQQIYTS